jgi:hypothetical protein
LTAAQKPLITWPLRSSLATRAELPLTLPNSPPDEDVHAVGGEREDLAVGVRREGVGDGSRGGVEGEEVRAVDRGSAGLGDLREGPSDDDRVADLHDRVHTPVQHDGREAAGPGDTITL